MQHHHRSSASHSAQQCCCAAHSGQIPLLRQLTRLHAVVGNGNDGPVSQDHDHHLKGNNLGVLCGSSCDWPLSKEPSSPWHSLGQRTLRRRPEAATCTQCGEHRIFVRHLHSVPVQELFWRSSFMMMSFTRCQQARSLRSCTDFPSDAASCATTSLFRSIHVSLPNCSARKGISEVIWTLRGPVGQQRGAKLFHCLR